VTDELQPEELVTINLGGKERTLKLTLGDLKRFSREFGKKDADGLEATTALLHMALSHSDPSVTPERVDDWVHLGNLRYVKSRLDLMQKGDSDAPLAATEAPTG
jgi:hypothetical protein